MDDLYKEIIIDHYKNPRNSGSLDDATVVKEGKNPLCGDELTLYLKITDDMIEDIKIESSGCSISLASASMMTKALKGQSISEVKEIVSEFKEMISSHEESISSDSTEDTKKDETDLLSHQGKLPLEIQALQGVVQYPVRIKCATLSWNTLILALEQE
jgi:nitrogen fixation NifU-like protein